MRTGKWELVIVWANEDVDCWEYETEEDALAADEGMKMANGCQIQWSCVRPQMVK